VSFKKIKREGRNGGSVPKKRIGGELLGKEISGPERRTCLLGKTRLEGGIIAEGERRKYRGRGNE